MVPYGSIEFMSACRPNLIKSGRPFVPVPGGIGVTEFGLTVGLTAAGMQEEAALAAVVLYRLATFYVPPVWGFFAMRWLQRNAHL